MRVISYKNLPARLPTFQGIVAWLLLDRLQAPGYVYGIVFTIIAIWALASIYNMVKETQVDLFSLNQFTPRR